MGSGCNTKLLDLNYKGRVGSCCRSKVLGLNYREGLVVGVIQNSWI